MKTDFYNNAIGRLTDKQFTQFATISGKVQPYLPFQEVVFIALVRLVIKSMNAWGNLASIRNDLAKFNDKYYCKGFKLNTHSLTGNQVLELYSSCTQPRMKSCLEKYEPIERDAFVMLFRACKRYLLTGRTKESEDVLIEKLRMIKNILN